MGPNPPIRCIPMIAFGIGPPNPHTVASRSQAQQADLRHHRLCTCASPSRRSLLGAAAVVPVLLPAQDASANAAAAPGLRTKTVLFPDGSREEVLDVGIDLDVVALRGSVAPQMATEIKQAVGPMLRVSVGDRPTLRDIYDELRKEKARQAEGDTNRGAKSGRRRLGQKDAVTMGNAWLGHAVREGLVQPIPDARRSRWWQTAGPRWQALVTRDKQGRLDPQGEVYGAPYRWGCTVVAANERLLRRAGGRPVRTWEDLLQEALRGRVAVSDSGRELLAIALRLCGHSVNAPVSEVARRPGGMRELERVMGELKRQVVVAGRDEHVRAFNAKDALVLVGYSCDVVPVAQRMADVSLHVPDSGTTLWADLWTVPAWADGGDLLRGPSPLLPLFLEFALQPSRPSARPTSSLDRGVSPLLLPGGAAEAVTLGDREWGSVGGAGAPFVPSRGALERSEFLEPLDAESAAAYAALLRA